MSSCKAITKLPNENAASHVCAAEAHLLWRRGTEALGELAEAAKVPSTNAEVLFFAKLAEGRSRELRRGTRGDQAAAVQENDIAAKSSGLAKIMCGHDDFDASRARKANLSYVVVPQSEKLDFSNLDRWYQRDNGEQIGKFILYRTQLREDLEHAADE